MDVRSSVAVSFVRVVGLTFETRPCEGEAGCFMAAVWRRKSDLPTRSPSDSFQGLKASVSTGSVHGEIIRRRGSAHMSSFSPRTILCCVVGFICGVVISIGLFVILVGYSVLIDTERVATDVQLSPQFYGTELFHISTVHAKWLSAASKHFHVRLPAAYSTWVLDEREYKQICDTWGQYVERNRLRVFLQKGHFHHPSVDCDIPYSTLPVTGGILKPISHVLNEICKELPSHTSKWYYLARGSTSYIDIKSFEAFLLQQAGDLSSGSFFGQLEIFQSGMSICREDFGALLSYEMLRDFCPLKHLCKDVFSDPRLSDLASLSVCVKDVLDVDCISLPGTKLVDNQIVFKGSKPRSPSVTLIYRLQQSDRQTYLEAYRHSLSQQLRKVLLTMEHGITTMTVLMHKMPQLRYIQRSPSKLLSTLPYDSPDDIVSFDLIQFKQVYSEKQSDPLKCFNEVISREVSQIEKKVSDILWLTSQREPRNFQIQSINRRLLSSLGMEYLIQTEAVGVSSTRLNVKKLYTISMVRPLQPPLVTNQFKQNGFPRILQSHPLPVTVVLNVSATVKQVEKEVADFCKRNRELLGRERDNLQILIIVPPPTDPEEISSLESAGEGCATGVNIVQVDHWPSLNDIECLVQGLRKTDPSRVLLFTDWQITLSFEFLTKCRAFSIPRKQMYVPIPFIHQGEQGGISDSEGFWPYKFYGTFCAWIDDFKWIFNTSENIPKKFTLGDFFNEWIFRGVHLLRALDDTVFHLYPERTEDSLLRENQERASISRRLFNENYNEDM